MPRWYVVNEHGDIIPAQLDEQGFPTTEYYQWLDNPENKIVVQETVNSYFVSTVFLGMDHGFDPEGPPVVYETMIFPHREDGKLIERDRWRYATRDEALAGHAHACKVAQGYGGGLDVEEIKRGAKIIEDLLNKTGKSL